MARFIAFIGNKTSEKIPVGTLFSTFTFALDPEGTDVRPVPFIVGRVSG